VDIRLHQIAERSIYHPMSRQGFDVLESIGNDPHDEVPSAVPRTRMAGMSMALVDDLERIGSERRFEAGANFRDA